MAMPLVSVVVPVYKEEASIAPFLARMVPVLEKIGGYEILFCLDPSPDRTQAVIEQAIARNPSIGMLVFSRRFGQTACTMAGIKNCSGQTCVTIDVDLQDPPELIADMYAKIREGNDVALARRRSRTRESFFRKVLAFCGYRLIRKIASIDIPADTGDFRMISRRVIEELKNMREGHSFLRGLVNYIGFKHTIIDYDREERLEGETKYNRFTGSIKIGMDGIVGFSSVPLTFVLWIGLSVCALCLLLILYTMVSKLLGTAYPLGIPTMTIALLFVGGVQMVSTGIIGEYIGRIYDEVRQRPNYIIDKAVNVKALS